MREQIIPHKVGNRSGIREKRRGSGMAQRPLRRNTGKSESLGSRVRAMLSYVPIILKLVVALVVGGLVFAGYRAAAAASFFQIRKVEIQGNVRASVEDVQALVKREVGETGVWRADLAEISAELKRLPWIRMAVVSRVLPDGIRVRLTERQPSAVVRMASGRFLWVDQDAVLLGEMLPTDQMPAFFLRGWDEEGGESARQKNSERVSTFMTLLDQWSNAGIAERVSEVNLNDLRDVRAQLAGDDSQVEVRLGSQDFPRRLKDALNVLDEHRQTPRGPFISYIDLTQGKRAIVGFMSGAHTIRDGLDAATQPSAHDPSEGRNPAKSKRNDDRPAASMDKKSERKREANRNETNTEQRPRRVRAT